MPVEEIIKQIEEQKKIITTAQKKQDELMRTLYKANEKDWDLVSVTKASEKSGLSKATIYRFINSGKLRCIHKGSKKYVSNSELEKLDCGYEE